MQLTDNDIEALRLRYLSDQIITASPARRLLMLFDYLASDLQSAKEAFAEGDLKGISDRLIHAQEIIGALRDPLDRTTDLGRSLDALYGYCLSELVRANFQKNDGLIEPVARMIRQIAEANRRVFAQISETTADVS